MPHGLGAYLDFRVGIFNPRYSLVVKMMKLFVEHQSLRYAYYFGLGFIYLLGFVALAKAFKG